MSRRMILVDLYWTRDKDPRVPLGHASLLAALRTIPTLDVRAEQLPVNDGDRTSDEVVTQLMMHVRGMAHDAVDIAFGAYVWGEELLREVLAGLRAREFSGRIILGGPQISYSGEGLEAIYPQADAFIRGYGEQALGELAQCSGRPPIVGVHWAGTIDQKAQARVDLESLPSPWLSGIVPLHQQRFVRWETQRGCQFRCAFCQHREAGARLPRHALLMARVEAEIDLFCESGVEEIAVLDPIFNLSPYAIPVLERFAHRGFKGRLSLQCRAEAITAEFLDAAAALDVCLEFGLQTIHRDESVAVKRGNQIGKIDEALAMVRARQLDHEVSLIFGLPLQTLSSFEESVRWCLERQVPVIKAFPLMLLRGTGLDRDRARWGLVESGGEMGMVISSHSFDRLDWRQMAKLSEALRMTEGAHPRSLDELKVLACALEPELLRWSP